MTETIHPERIVKDLHDLWVSLGQEESGVLRACAMTFIVVAEDEQDPGRLGETLAELMQDHPSRAIVVRLRPGEEMRLEARVFAQCWLPFGQHKQICSEQIEITSSLSSLPDIAPVLLALAAPDLPVVVWRRAAGTARAPQVRAIEGLADKLILDSEAGGDALSALTGLAREARASRLVSDLAWTRLTGWRETVAQVFECAPSRACRRDVAEAIVSYGGASLPVPACYLAGWLAATLGWDPQDRRLRVSAGAGAGLIGLAIRAPGLEIDIEGSRQPRLVARINGLPHYVAITERSEAALLGEELSLAGLDAIYERSLAAAIEIARRWSAR